MKIVVTLDVSEESINLDNINDPDNLEQIGREDEPFESKLAYLEVVAQEIVDGDRDFNEVIDELNAVVEAEASE